MRVINFEEPLHTVIISKGKGMSSEKICVGL